MSGAPFARRAAVAQLLAGRQDLLVVSGLGAPSYDVAAAGDHARNFYLWGAMGGACMVGLGLALAQPALPVLVVTGDGEMLMGLGGLATVALRNPGNLTIAVLDNGLYGETGGQASHTSGPTHLPAVARGCGLGDCRDGTDAAGLAALAARGHQPGPGRDLRPPGDRSGRPAAHPAAARRRLPEEPPARGPGAAAAVRLG